MFLLQSGANIDLNVTTAPVVNLVIVFGCIMIMFFVLVFVIIRYVKKIGPLELDKDTIESQVYEMNRDIFSVDDQMRMRIRTITSSLKTRLRNIFYEAKMCPVAVIALTNSALGPLYDSAANNHFTTVMMPEHREEYLNKLLRAIEDEYRSTYNAMRDFECSNDKTGVMPRWEGKNGNDISPRERVHEFLKEWVNNVTAETIKACTKKIEVYKSYESAFKGNKYRSDVLAACITKNERYKSLLDWHGGEWH